MLTTSVIGSYARPSWFISANEAIQRGEFGDTDIKETLNDAVDIAVRDQIEAGVDLISDGEMRRHGFFTAGFYDRLTGLEELPPKRKLGPTGHDQRERFDAVEPMEAPEGLGIVEEYEYLSSRTDHPVKVPCPGPFTLAGRIMPGEVYGTRMEAARAFSEIINEELHALTAAGAEFIQMDEPSYAVHPDRPQAFVKLFNHTIDDIDSRIGLHLCFGNFVGRPVAHRTYEPLFPYILDVDADELAMEFANREGAELELIERVVEPGKSVAVGVIDVKNYYVEPPKLVADRIRDALEYVSPGKLVLTPDCGLSQTARWAARAKLESMVEGARIVRREISGDA
jgi:5-methyltetrahydropteroyltriglutamate--homocysteine methyltransferase